MNHPGAEVLEIRDLLVKRGKSNVLSIPYLPVYENEVLAVIGPNGSGKSTLLLVLSLLIRPTSGQVLFRGSPLQMRQSLAYRRKIGLVLQDPLLLDASVYANVAAGLRFRGLPNHEVRPRVEEWLDKLGIRALRHRPAKSLSGGEAQRVSLARAFALKPEVLLLDEPFSSLDAPTHARMLDDFQALAVETAVTTVFVTHDLNEALLVSQRIAVLIGGTLRQVGAPGEIFNNPADTEIAEFVGVETVIPGQVIRAQDGLLTIQAGAFTLEAVGDEQPGRQVLACLRPEDIILSSNSGNNDIATQPSTGNYLKGSVARTTSQGPLVRVVVDCGFPLVALVTRSSAEELDLTPGVIVTATFKANALHLIHRAGS